MRLNPDKAQPSVRRGRKAAGLEKKMAELPKDEPLVSSAFYFDDHLVVRAINVSPDILIT